MTDRPADAADRTRSNHAQSRHRARRERQVGIVLQGEIVLELDDGDCTPLSTGDIVIQNGTRHAWRNRSDRPATMAFVLIGAEGGG